MHPDLGTQMLMVPWRVRGKGLLSNETDTSQHCESGHCKPSKPISSPAYIWPPHPSLPHTEGHQPGVGARVGPVPPRVPGPTRVPQPRGLHCGRMAPRGLAGPEARLAAAVADDRLDDGPVGGAPVASAGGAAAEGHGRRGAGAAGSGKQGRRVQGEGGGPGAGRTGGRGQVP